MHSSFHPLRSKHISNHHIYSRRARYINSPPCSQIPTRTQFICISPSPCFFSEIHIHSFQYVWLVYPLATCALPYSGVSCSPSFHVSALVLTLFKIWQSSRHRAFPSQRPLIRLSLRIFTLIAVAVIHRWRGSLPGSSPASIRNSPVQTLPHLLLHANSTSRCPRSDLPRCFGECIWNLGSSWRE